MLENKDILIVFNIFKEKILVFLTRIFDNNYKICYYEYVKETCIK